MPRVMLLLALLAPSAWAQPFLTPTPPPVAPPPPALASGINDQARFLSGLRVSPGSPLAGLQGSPEYLDHARAYATTWRKFDARYFGAMRTFAAEQLAPRLGAPRPVYYLFGGPDFINVFAFFPDAPVYILGGLEPVGSLVPPEQLDAARIKAGLDNLRASTDVTLSFSHFITKDMKTELELTDFKGVLPILLSFLTLGGGEVLAVQPFSPGNGIPGVEIQFRRNAAAATQFLYYVQADVSNDGLKARPALLAWMQRFGPAVTYLKAASYLMHEPYFSRVREFLLTNSQAVLQDDSGIPLRFLAGWQITFFGAYTQPLDLFKKYFQPDLGQAYQTSNPVPLAFGTGYKWKVGESNLMLAVKPAVAPRAEPATGGLIVAPTP